MKSAMVNGEGMESSFRAMPGSDGGGWGEREKNPYYVIGDLHEVSSDVDLSWAALIWGN